MNYTKQHVLVIWQQVAEDSDPWEQKTNLESPVIDPQTDRQNLQDAVQRWGTQTEPATPQDLERYRADYR